jgi:two-component system nitrate/nitrite response regulator NarL
MSMNRADVVDVDVHVLVVDDIRLSREALLDALAGETVVAAAAAAGDLQEALQLLAEQPFEVILVSMASLNSVAVCRELVAAAPCAHVVALAVSGSDDEVIACAEAGVAGYLLRGQSHAELLQAIVGAVRGETVCPPRVAAALMRRVSTLATERRRESGPGRLTPREHQILGLIDQGLSNREIARQLSIEERTVKNHVHNLLEKLKVSRRGEAAAMLRSRQRVDSRLSTA